MSAFFFSRKLRRRFPRFSFQENSSVTTKELCCVVCSSCRFNHRSSSFSTKRMRNRLLMIPSRSSKKLNGSHLKIDSAAFRSSAFAPSSTKIKTFELFLQKLRGFVVYSKFKSQHFLYKLLFYQQFFLQHDRYFELLQ